MSMMTYTLYSPTYRADQMVLITYPPLAHGLGPNATLDEIYAKRPRFPVACLIGQEGTLHNEWMRHTRLESLAQKAPMLATISLSSAQEDECLDNFALHEIKPMMTRLFPLSPTQWFLVDLRHKPLWTRAARADVKETFCACAGKAHGINHLDPFLILQSEDDMDSVLDASFSFFREALCKGSYPS